LRHPGEAELPKKVTIEKGDTLCGIAMREGFLNCDPIRSANPELKTRPIKVGDVVVVPDPTSKISSHHTTDQIHKFIRKNTPPVSIRFVHGSKLKQYSHDTTLKLLNISNYVADEAGRQGGHAFPTGFGFDKLGDEDEDTFKVEVVDPVASGTIKVKLEALRPFYKPDNTIDHHDTFAGSADAADRRIDDLECQQVKAGQVAFRSRYLRLVVDKTDNNNGTDKQKLLATEMVDAGDPKVEILDQDVRGTYVVLGCRAASFKCTATTNIPLERGKFFDLAVRIMRGTPSGIIEKTVGGPGDNGIVKLADMRTRVQKFVRSCWAQAHLKPNLVLLQTMDLPSDMFSVADQTGLSARGNQLGSVIPGQIGFTIRIKRFGGGPNEVHVVAPFNVPAGSNPKKTAELIKTQVELIAGLSATVSPNPPETGNAVGSCDVLLSDTAGGRVTITNLTPLANQDQDQKILSVGLTLTINKRNSFQNYHVGHPEQRNLVKSLNTAGDIVIDVTVVEFIVGTGGFTVPENKTLIASRRPTVGVKNSIILPKESGDGTPNMRFALPHEIGHVLTDDGLHADALTELMQGGLLSQANAATMPATVKDSKRILEHDPDAENWNVFKQNPDGSVGSLHTKLNATSHVLKVSKHLLHH
jgi:hypothetical protein